jgi:hypothetical protein
MDLLKEPPKKNPSSIPQVLDFPWGFFKKKTSSANPSDYWLYHMT